MAYFDEKPSFGEAKVVDENGRVLRTIPTFSFNVDEKGRRVTLLNPVLVPRLNTLDVKVDGDKVTGMFRVNIASHEGVYFHEQARVVPSVTCTRQSRPHALNSHGENFPCDDPKEVTPP